MTHLVMIEIAKMRKPVRERVIDLCNRNLCLKCEAKPQHSCGRCPGCLNEVYQAAKYLSPLEQLERVRKMIATGTLLKAWDNTYKPRRAKKAKTTPTDQSQGMAG